MFADRYATRRSVFQGLVSGTCLMALGCAPSTRDLIGLYPRAYSRKRWARPNVSMDAVIRVIVGHRPYRPGGFRVEREQFDDKILVHNYGHGGGGLSLGWGSSALAVREIANLASGNAAVIGSGIMGLCTSRLLQDAGWTVTIYARDTYRHTTSSIAVGEWGPYSTHDDNVVDPTFLAKLDWAARISHHAYTNLTGGNYGIRWIESYELADTPPSETSGLSFDDLFAYRGNLQPGEHPFGDRYARRVVTMQIDPGVLLRQLSTDFRVAGGNFVSRTFDDLAQVLELSESVVFNCTGLGAAVLFDDPELIPAKGQLVFLPPDPGIDFSTLGGGRGLLYMSPRSDVMVLGGTNTPGEGSSTADPAETERIVEEHRELFESFG